MEKQTDIKLRLIDYAQLCVNEYQCSGDDDYIHQAIAYLTAALKAVPAKE